MRAKSTVAKHKRRKRMFKRAKGAVGGRSRLARTAMENVERGWKFAFRDRKNKKREFRALWVTRLSAAARQRGLNYNRLIEGLRKANYAIDRKILAHLAATDAKAFDQIVELAKSKLN